MIEITNLHKSYLTSGGEVHAVNGCSLKFPDKGLFFIEGKSGCGKTTLLNLIAGLDSYDSGLISVNSVDISGFSETEFDTYRNISTGIIFQNYNLIPGYSVSENVALPLKIQSWDSKSKDEISAKIKKMLDFVGLSGYENRKPSELSGGEQQRVAIARALIKDPSIILADEPTGNLDGKNAETVLSILKTISREKLVIVVTHDFVASHKFGDAIIHISDGKIVSTETLSSKKNLVYTVSKRSGIDEISILGENLTAEEASALLISGIRANENPDIKLEISASMSTENKENTVSQSNIVNSNKIRTNPKPQGLLWSDIVTLSFAFMKRKKFRLVISVILLALISAMLFSSLFVLDYDCCAPCSQYLETFKPLGLSVLRNGEYENSLCEIVSEDVSCGKKLYNELKAIVGEDNIYKTFTGITLSDIDNQYYFDNVTFVCGGEKMYTLSEGRFPTMENEIALSDYICNLLHIDINDTVSTDDCVYKVSGIIKTDYDNKLLEKTAFGIEDDFLQYSCQFLYFVAITTKDSSIGNNKSDLFSSRGSNFLISQSERYFKTVTTYGPIDSSAIVLTSGSFPQNSTEVLISDVFFYMQGLELDFSENKSYHFSFTDVYNKKYNGCYDGLLNLSSFFKDGVTITGVYSRNDTGTIADVLIDQNTFDALQNEYNSYFSSDYYLVSTEALLKSDALSAFLGKDFETYEPGISTIITIKKGFEKIAPVLIGIVIIVSVVSILAMTEFVSNSIKENEKSLGILKALGVRGKDVSKIFVFETVWVAFISALCAVIFELIILKVVNLWFGTTMSRQFNIICWNHSMGLVTLSSEFMFTVISTLFTIRNLSVKDTIKILRGNE